MDVYRAATCQFYAREGSREWLYTDECVPSTLNPSFARTLPTAKKGLDSFYNMCYVSLLSHSLV